MAKDNDLKIPLSVSMTAAKNDLDKFLSELQDNYMIPFWLLNYIVSSSLADIRAAANRDTISELLKATKGEDEETPDYSKGVVLASKDDMTKQEPTTK